MIARLGRDRHAPVRGPRARMGRGESYLEQASRAFSDGQVALDESVVVPIADDAAYALGTEHGQAKLGGESVRIDWRVTNIYRREGEERKVVHHHTDVSPAVVDALER